jgi:integration host factor subunit beta
MRLMEFPAGFPRPPKPPKSFTRSELIRSIYERFQRNLGEEDRPRLRRRAQAESLVLAVLDEIAGALERGMRVELRGVGVLSVKQKDGRQGRNPRTGEAVVIDPHRVVRFKASEVLLVRLNRPASRPSERRESDPRQLAFPIAGHQAESADSPALPRLARRRITRRQGMIYEQGE